MKQLRFLLVAAFLVTAIVPAFGISTTPTFKATKTSDSPSGAGMIYGYRGGGDYAPGANGQNDKLTLPGAGDWKSADNTLTVFSSEIKFQETSPTGNQEPDGYQIMDKTDNSGGATKMALHMYFFAKPNPGYQFNGWFDKDGNELTGSRDHYPMPGVTSGVSLVDKKGSGSYTPSTWDNGEGLTAASGYYPAGGFYYLRNVYTFKTFEGTTVYAKFSIIPRTFTLAKTGHDAVYYTATGYSGNIANEQKTTSEINSNISLAINIPDPEKYTFEGWYWSDGKDGSQTLISESPSATFSWTGNSDIVAKMNTVWIWPKVTKIVNNVAEVTYNEVTTSYESWDEALAAAKEVSGATITLNKSVSDLSAVQTINKSMTINLNGNTLSGTANNFFTITGSGVEVTITDNSSQGNGRIDLANSTDAETYAVSVRSGAKLTISGGTICNVNASNASGTARGVEAQSGTTIIVTGGHIEGQSLKNAYALINRGTATISGGDMYAHTTSGAYNVGTAVAFYNVGTTNTITGGTFRAYSYTNKAYGIQQNVNNTLTINDATVRTETRGKSRNSKDDDDIYIGGQSYALYYSQGKIIVNGGKYYAINQGNTSQKEKRDAHYAVAPVNVANNAQVTIYGGVYLTHHNLAACAASGYVRTDLLYEDPDYTAGYRYTVVNSSTESYVCKVLTTLDVIYYKTLEEAFAYVNEHSTQDLTIVITSTNCTLSAGTYTVPSSVKLLLPFDVEGTISMGENMDENPIYYNYNATRTRECYSKLTLESGVNLKIYGKLNVNALLHNRAGGSMVANVLDNYGRIHMNEGSHIDLESGSACTVWGFITGDGTITAKSGSMVREAFQFDFRGGTHISNTYATAFPMCQYYVQNIEAPITFNYGATENVFTCCYANYGDRIGSASFIGSDGMFRLVSGSTLTRHYVGSEDRIYYDLYGNASIQDITVDVEIAEMASKDYILPINNNMTLRIHSGTTTIYYDLSLLPDSRVVIDEGATVEIKQNFYIYDKSDWRADETGYTYEDSNKKTQKSYFAVSGDLNLLPFSPTKTFTRTSAGLTDAHVIVNGTLKTLSTKGKLYTTTHGADITSEGSGKVILGVAAGANTSFKQGISTASKTQAIPVTAAQLHNGNDTYIATSGAAANAMYQYCDGTWTPGGCINYYTITWKSEDGNTTLETDEDVMEGSASSFNGTTPSKDATAQYTYTFDGWTTAANGGGDFYAKGATPTAAANATYYAHFSQTPVSYTLSWVTDGDALTGDYTHGSVAYGTSIVAPSTPTKTGYSFAAWTPTPAATMPAATTTYTATWTPNTTTAYTVKHYKQNIDGTYPTTPTETDNLTGTTGASVTPAVKSYEGFDAPAAQTVTILADGSRVVTYNYTRKSYTLTWVTDGDALTGDYTSGSTKFGAAIIAPNTPTKTGYTFASWSPAKAETMPAAATEYTATWTPNTNTAYTVKHYQQNLDGTYPSTPTNTDNLTGTTATEVTPAVKSYEGFDAPAAQTVTILADGSRVVEYQYTRKSYTLTWVTDGDALTGDYTSGSTKFGAAIIAPNTPTKTGYVFDGWHNGTSVVTPAATMPAVTTTYTATWHIASSDVLEVGETHEKQITINSNETVTTTIVHADGKLNVSAGTLTTTDLILEASENASGQIIGADKITLTPSTGNAYFDLTHTGGFKARTWYAVAVPWEVFVPTNNVGGVYLKKGELEPVQQTLGTTFDLIFYDGERRAAGENKAWTYVEDYYADPSHAGEYPVMKPGVAYMIYLTSDADVIRFRKSDADLTLYHYSTQVTKHDSPKTADEHWNGIANPATYHARIDLSSAGVGFGQVYSDPINQLYSVFDLSKKLLVGQPVFVQVNLTSSVAVSTPSLARRRAKEQVSITRYDLMLAASDADVTDRVIVRMDEEKTENEYVIGQDLVKMGVSNKAPQMWIDRYGEKMCVNTVAGFDNTADYPLGIFAPKNGEYDLFIDDQPNDETMLYLTYDGEAIWNLSYGGYVVSLDKGTNTHYGLRIAKKAPQITTGIEETTIQNGEAVRKVLVNDKVYIIRNGEIYSVTGQKAK